eukprot:m.888883 g.888883  ORF g.888883 m.888883 type:complete len:601 (-) comp23640_c0_seq6:2298-4100(-)
MSDGVDVTLLAIGGAVAAAVGAVVMNMINKPQEEDDVDVKVLAKAKPAEAAKKAQKSKKKKTQTKKKPVVAPVDESEDADDEIADDVVVVPTPSPPPVTSSKNKKKKKKKAAAPEEPPAPPPSKKALKKEKKAAAAKAAATAVATTETQASANATASSSKKKKNADRDEGWEVVQSSSSSSRSSAPVTTTSDSTGGVTKTTLDIKGHKSAVIGAKGAVIQNIQAVSGAKIDIGKEDSSQCTVTGAEADVAVAVKMITEIVSERNEFDANQQTKTIDVPADMIPSIIGKGGATIKMIQTNAGVSINIDKESKVVTVKGTAGAVATAEQLIKDIVSPTYEANTTMDLKLHPMGQRAVYVIMGHKGETVRGIERETGAKIDIDRSTLLMTIKGAQADVVRALTAVSKVLSENNNEVVIPVVDQKTVGAILGRGGATIRMFEEKSKASLKLDGQKLIIQGTKEQVSTAQALVTALLEGGPIKPSAAPGEELAEVACPAAAIGAIIGKGGADIKALQESTGARVEVPRGLNVCWVVGKPDAVKKAKKIIKDKVDEVIKQEQEREARNKLAAANAASTSEQFSAAGADSAGDDMWGTSVTGGADGW